jgi:hypothetical protein
VPYSPYHIERSVVGAGEKMFTKGKIKSKIVTQSNDASCHGRTASHKPGNKSKRLKRGSSKKLRQFLRWLFQKENLSDIN